MKKVSHKEMTPVQNYSFTHLWHNLAIIAILPLLQIRLLFWNQQAIFRRITFSSLWRPWWFVLSGCRVIRRTGANYDGAYTWAPHDVRDEQACIQTCIDRYPNCSAVDFNLQDKACALHEPYTGIGLWQDNSCCNRYEIIFCRGSTQQFSGLCGIRCSVESRIQRSVDQFLTGSAKALHCYTVHSKFHRKMENSTPCKMITPENFFLKLSTHDYVEDVTYRTIFDVDGQWGFSPSSWNITFLWLFFLSCPVLSFLLQSPARSARPMFTL